MHTTPRERRLVYDEILSDLLSMSPGDTQEHGGVTVECITTSEFAVDGLSGYGAFAAADTLADKHRQYCQ